MNNTRLLEQRNRFRTDKSLILACSAGGVVSLWLSYIFPFHLVPWATFYNEWLFALAVGAGSTVVMLRSLGHDAVVSHPLPWGGILLLSVAQAGWLGFNVPMHSTGLLVSCLFVLVGWLAYTLGRNLFLQGWLSAVLNVLLCAALVSAAIAALQWAGVLEALQGLEGYIRSTEAGGRAPSNIGQANNLGTLLVVGCWVVAYAWNARPRNLWWQVLAVLAMGLLTLAMHASGSRTAFLNLALAPVLLFCWTRWRRQPFAWQVLVPLLWWGIWFLVLPYVSEVLGLVLPEARSMASDNARPRLWLMVFTAVAEQPWLGYGFGGMSNVHLQFSSEYGNFDDRIATSAHNIVLDMWVTFGVVLGSAIVGFFVWLWVRAWLACKTSADQFVWLMATAMIVHAMLEYPLHYGFFFWLLCLLLGALGGKPWKTVTVKRPLLAATLWLMVFGAGAYTVWSAYVDTESMYTLYRQQGATAAQKALHQQRDSMGAKLYPELHARLYWLTTPMDEVSHLTDEQLTALENEARYYPLPMLGWRVAFAQAYRGNAEQAAWWAERMCKMFDPQVCASAQQEWLRRGEAVPGWPVLPWKSWVKDGT
jgi:O-antigen ligase